MDNNKSFQQKIQNIKSEDILFFFQVLIISIVVCASLLNLTLQWGNQNLWTVILTASMGYIMPNPKPFVSTKKSVVEDSTSDSSI